MCSTKQKKQRVIVNSFAISCASVSTITYAYDADGHRTQQSINGTVTKFVWDEFSRYDDVLVELDTNNNITTSYVYGAMGLLSQKQGSDTRYLLTDVQNSTRVLLNANNTVAADYAYDAFGSLTSTDSGLTKYLYTGQQFDATTQLYSLRARYYAPEQGRFLSRDTYPYDFQNPVELNRYVYAANNPVMLSDPSGYTLQSFAQNLKDSALRVLNTVGRFMGRKTVQDAIDGAIGALAGDFGGRVFASLILSLWNPENRSGTLGDKLAYYFADQFRDTAFIPKIIVVMVAGAFIGASHSLMSDSFNQAIAERIQLVDRAIDPHLANRIQEQLLNYRDNSIAILTILSSVDRVVWTNALSLTAGQIQNIQQLLFSFLIDIYDVMATTGIEIAILRAEDIVGSWTNANPTFAPWLKTFIPAFATSFFNGIFNSVKKGIGGKL